MLDKEVKSLKPMTVSEILDNTFKIYGRNFLAIMLFSLIIGGIFTLLSSYVGFKAMPADLSSISWQDIFNNPESLPDMDFQPMDVMLGAQIKIMLISLVGGIFVMPFVQGGIINIAYRDIQGSKLMPGNAFSQGLKNFGRWILTGLSLMVYSILMVIAIFIVGLIVFLPLVFFGISVFGGQPTGGSIALFIVAGLLGLGVIIFAGLSLGTFISFVYQATIEGKSAFTAIARSFALTTKKFWRVLGINLLFHILIGVIVGILAIISGITSLLAPNLFMANFALSFIITGFVTPISYIATTLLFFDTRARVEGQPEIISEEL